MDKGDLDDIRVELLAEQASLDIPTNRTRQGLIDRLARANDALGALDDVDDLPTRACELTERLRREVHELAQAAVRFDRARGATWEEIGALLGISRQAAWERFGP